MKTAFIFPGQGSQYVGMGKEIANHYRSAMDIYNKANDKLGYNLKDICFEGPLDVLQATEHTQPAILTTSIAIVSILKEAGIQCDITAGLSLGEYSALVYAGVMSFSDAVEIVRNRGRYMQEDVPIGVGGMAAIIGLSHKDVETCLVAGREEGIVEIANYNAPGQIVISGEKKAVKKSGLEAKKRGAKNVVMLPVSAPFHCSLLKTAGEKLKINLEHIIINKPETPIIMNIDAKLVNSIDDIKLSLIQQVSTSVMWQQSIELMLKDGTTRFIEIGPSNTLSGMVKKIANNKEIDIDMVTINSLEDLEGFLKSEMCR